MALDPEAAAEKRSVPADPGRNAQSAPEGSAHSPEEQAAGEEGLTREQKRVTPEEVRRHAIAQGTDEPSIPRGRNPDSAMCEDRAHPGRIDKDNDC